jgi:cytochrome c553
MVHALYSVPWDPANRQLALDALSLDQLAARFDLIPPGVMARHGTGPWSPVQVPDLIGVAGRRFLDRTGLQRHRSPADLMRYAALNQGMDQLTRFDGVLASGQTEREPAEHFFQQRYSDEQLFALTKFLYALKPPPNPNLPRNAEEHARVERGRALFMSGESRCATCHDPDQGYTNNQLVAVPGFEVPEDHPERSSVMSRRVNTDGELAVSTRRGTGLYKVPSLLGVWYRGPFEHNGSCATLEDWFDPARLRDDYVPTGWRGPWGTKTRAVRGHEYGLDLSGEDRRALIAFLRTL